MQNRELAECSTVAARGLTGLSLYVMAGSADGSQLLNYTTGNFEVINLANWPDYTQPLTEISSQLAGGDGWYQRTDARYRHCDHYAVYCRLGEDPAANDPIVASGHLRTCDDASLTGCVTEDPEPSLVILSGLTYSVANNFTEPTHPAGTHLHTTNGTSDGTSLAIPAVGEAGGFFGDEEVRCHSEFDMVGQVTASNVVLKFNVIDASQFGTTPSIRGGLFGQPEYTGDYQVQAYNGNNAEDVGDFGAAVLLNVGNFTGGLIPTGGTVMFDVTSLFNSRVGTSSLGFKLRLVPTDMNEGALTFGNFRLEITA